MQELINNLIQKVGLTPDQAAKSIETIKDFVKEKFPMLEGAVENMFGSQSQDSGGSSDFMKTAESTVDGIKDKLSGLFSENK
jgi:hypothetical protein